MILLFAVRDVLFSLTVRLKSVLTPEPNIGSFLGHILRETLLRFQLKSLETWTEWQLNFWSLR